MGGSSQVDWFMYAHSLLPVAMARTSGWTSSAVCRVDVLKRVNVNKEVITPTGVSNETCEIGISRLPRLKTHPSKQCC